jgi:hypothetical protein
LPGLTPGQQPGISAFLILRADWHHISKESVIKPQREYFYGGDPLADGFND